MGIQQVFNNHPAIKYLFKVDNRSTERCEIYLKLKRFHENVIYFEQVMLDGTTKDEKK